MLSVLKFPDRNSSFPILKFPVRNSGLKFLFKNLLCYAFNQSFKLTNIEQIPPWLS